MTIIVKENAGPKLLEGIECALAQERSFYAPIP